MNYNSLSPQLALYPSDLLEYHYVNYFIKKRENKLHLKEKLYIYSCKNYLFSLASR